MADRLFTLATPANMAAFEAHNPERHLTMADGSTVTIARRRAIALSPSTGEECSGSSGDYWDRPAGLPLKDADGEPMLLVTEHTIYKDALTGERI